MSHVYVSGCGPTEPQRKVCPSVSFHVFAWKHGVLFAFLLLAGLAASEPGRADVIAAMGAKHALPSTRLVGPIRTVRQERVLFVNPPGQPSEWVEDERILTDVARYDRLDRLIEKTSYAPDGAQSVRLVRTYDAAGRLTVERLYDAADRLWRTTDYTYDAEGHLVLAVSSDADGDLWFRDVYRPNPDGTPARVDHHDPDGTLLHSARFTYDEQGRIARRSLSDADGSAISGNAYTYGPTGRVIEVASQGRNGALVSRWLFRHDEHGNEREWVELGADGALRKKEAYAYEYDGRGNWLKRVTSEWVPRPDGPAGAGVFEPAEAVYRTLTYDDSKK